MICVYLKQSLSIFVDYCIPKQITIEKNKLLVRAEILHSPNMIFFMYILLFIILIYENFKLFLVVLLYLCKKATKKSELSF